MPTTPPKRQPRLKESCDRCSVAKVRCNKDKPSCSRCAQKGLPCGYSYSRRAGRRTTSSLASMAAIIEQRSDSSSPTHLSHTPSLASISPHLSASPGGVSDDSDIFPDMWSFPPANQPGQIPSSMPQQFGWDDNLYALQNTTFDQPFGFPAPVPGDQSLVAPMDALGGMDASLLPAFNSMPQPALPTEQPLAPTSAAMHRTSTSTTSTYSEGSDGSQADAVQDELANLTDFAEAMEKKFDAVVRQRMQYRDVCTEFGVPPMDELDPSNHSHSHHSSMSSTSSGDIMMGGLSGNDFMSKSRQSPSNGGSVPSPDLSELSMYYSLAELKRRLKWLREDVGNLVVAQPA